MSWDPFFDGVSWTSSGGGKLLLVYILSYNVILVPVVVVLDILVSSLAMPSVFVNSKHLHARRLPGAHSHRSPPIAK